MVKKIGVFITVFGLVFLGVPRFNVEAQGVGVEVDYYYRTVWESAQTVWVPEMNADINTVISEINGSVLFGVNNLDVVIRSEIDNDIIYQGSPDYIYFMSVGDGILVIDGVLISNDWYDMVYYSYSIIQTSYSEIDGAYIKGVGDARDTYGIYFNGSWRSAEWYGNYRYNQGLTETDATGFNSLLVTVFSGLGSLLAIEILPNIYIGAIIAVPLVFGIIAFILGKRKGD